MSLSISNLTRVLVGALMLSASLVAAQTTPTNVPIPPYSFFLFAGSPQYGSQPTASRGFIDGNGTNARFNAPTGIAIDTNGNLYVADTGNNAIRKIDSNDNVTTLTGQSGQTGDRDGVLTNASFDGPYGLAIDSLGNIYLSDVYSDIIRKVGTNGIVSTLAGNAYYGPGDSDGSGPNASFNNPEMLFIDQRNNIYVADNGNNAIRLVSTNGNVSTISTGSLLLKGPSDLVINSAGTMFIVDNGDNIIDGLLPDDFSYIVAGGNTNYSYSEYSGTNAAFSSPTGVALTRSGNLIVADSGNNFIRSVDTNGNNYELAGTFFGTGSTDGPGTNAQFNNPTGVVLDPAGNIYVSDTGNNTIRKIDTNHVVSTIAGAAAVAQITFRDGPKNQALFNSPLGIASDHLGNLYIADTGNKLIRKIDTHGIVSTLAGGGSGTTDTNGNWVIDGNGTNAEFFNPIGLTVDALGNVYVVDDGYGLRKIDSHTNVTTVLDYSLSLPGVASDNFGNIYVYGTPVLSQRDSIIKVAPDQSKSTLPGPYEFVVGIVCDTLGNVYIADSGKSQILKVSTNNIFSVIAGAPHTYAVKDGSGTKAAFAYISGIAIDSNNIIYVSDQPQSDAYIRKVTTNGIVSTIGTLSYLPVPGLCTGPNNTIYLANGELNTITAGYYASTNLLQVLYFPQIPPKVYGEKPFAVLVDDSANLPLTLSSSDTNVATVKGIIVSIVGAGTSTITAKQAGNALYYPDMFGEPLVVSKASQKIAFIGLPTSIAYGKGKSFTLHASNLPGMPVAFSTSNTNVISLHDHTAKIVGRGQAQITAYNSGNANYNQQAVSKTVNVK